MTSLRSMGMDSRMLGFLDQGPVCKNSLNCTIMMCLFFGNIHFNKKLKTKQNIVQDKLNFTQGLPVYDCALMECRQTLDALDTKINKIQFILS